MKEGRLNLRDLLDIGMMMAIFFMSAIEVASFYFQAQYDTVDYKEVNLYILYYYPLLSSMTTLTASSFFLFRIMRFDCCFCTKAITTAFFLNQLATVCLIYKGYNSPIYNQIIYPIYLFTMFILFLYFGFTKTKTYFRK